MHPDVFWIWILFHISQGTFLTIVPYSGRHGADLKQLRYKNVFTSSDFVCTRKRQKKNKQTNLVFALR